MWRRRLFAWEEEIVRECSVLLHNIVLQVNVYDTWQWLLDPIHGYSVRGAYHYFTKNPGTMDRSQVDDVWLKQIPSKVSLLVWRLLRNRLPTKDNLAQRGVLASTDMACSAGFDTTETVTHLFLHCTISSDLWSKVQNWLRISLVLSGDMRQHFVQFTKMAGMPRSSHYFFALIWFATIWMMWKDQNSRVFQNTTSNSFTLIEKIQQQSFLWLKSKHLPLAFSYHDWCNHPLLCMGVRM